MDSKLKLLLLVGEFRLCYNQKSEAIEFSFNQDDDNLEDKKIVSDPSFSPIPGYQSFHYHYMKKTAIFINLFVCGEITEKSKLTEAITLTLMWLK